LAKTGAIKAHLVGEDIISMEDLVFDNKPLRFKYLGILFKQIKVKKGEEKMEAAISILKGKLNLSELKKPGETSLELKLDLEPVLVEDADKESYSLLFKGSLNLEEGTAAEITFKKPETLHVP